MIIISKLKGIEGKNCHGKSDRGRRGTHVR
jgi:hypothetical protein